MQFNPTVKEKIAIVLNDRTMGNAVAKLGLSTEIAAVFKYLNNMFPFSFFYILGNKDTYSN